MIDRTDRKIRGLLVAPSRCVGYVPPRPMRVPCPPGTPEIARAIRDKRATTGGLPLQIKPTVGRRTVSSTFSKGGTEGDCPICRCTAKTRSRWAGDPENPVGATPLWLPYPRSMPDHRIQQIANVPHVGGVLFVFGKTAHNEYCHKAQYRGASEYHSRLFGSEPEHNDAGQECQRAYGQSVLLTFLYFLGCKL
jgi:hypothetical protein